MVVRVCSLWNNYIFFFFKQKTAYDMCISDWSSDVCSSDLVAHVRDDSMSGLRHYVHDSALGAVGSASAMTSPAAATRWPRAARISPSSQLEIGRASCRERVCPYV